MVVIVPVLLLTTLSLNISQLNGVMFNGRAGFCLGLYRCAQPRRCEKSHTSSHGFFLFPLSLANDYLFSS